MAFFYVSLAEPQLGLNEPAGVFILALVFEDSLVFAQHNSEAGVFHPGHLGVVPPEHLRRGEHHLEV